MFLFCSTIFHYYSREFETRENKIAKGIAIGTASHAVGTSRAIEMGETEGAMSGLAIGVAGILTVFILPLLYLLLF